MEVEPRPSSSIDRPTGNGAVTGISRRRFLNRAVVQSAALGAAAWGAASFAFLWPAKQSKGFGGIVHAGPIAPILSTLTSTRQPLYVAEARAYVSLFPDDAVTAAKHSNYPPQVIPVLEQGLIVQSQTCPHLGCRVRWCDTSQWFECPCHGSKYNRVGEKKAGPAPRGMSLVSSKVEHGELVIDSGTILHGMPIGSDTTRQEAEGPFCFHP